MPMRTNKVTTRTPLDTTVEWGADMKPTAHPYLTARLFMVKGKTAWVIWHEDPSMRPMPVYAGALVVS